MTTKFRPSSAAVFEQAVTIVEKAMLPDDDPGQGTRSRYGRPVTHGRWTLKALITLMLILVLRQRTASFIEVVDYAHSELTDAQADRLGIGALVQARRSDGSWGEKKVQKSEYTRLRQQARRLLSAMDPHWWFPLDKRLTNAQMAQLENALTPSERARADEATKALMNLCGRLINASIDKTLMSGYQGDVFFDETVIDLSGMTAGTGARPDALRSNAPLAAIHSRRPPSGRDGDPPTWAYGLTLTGAIWPLYGRSTPLVMTAMSWAQPTGGTKRAAIDAVDVHIANGFGPAPGRHAEAIADQGFTHKHGLSHELLRRGYRVVQEVAEYRTRPFWAGDDSGVLFWNQTPICPEGLDPAHLPATFPRLPQPRAGKAAPEDLTEDHVIRQAAAIREVEPHLMRWLEKPTVVPRPRVGRPPRDAPAPEDSVRVRVECPARVGKVYCDFVDHPDVTADSHPMTWGSESRRRAAEQARAAGLSPQQPDVRLLPRICKQGTAVVHLTPDEAKFVQHRMPGSFDHADDYGRARSRNEVLNAHVKDSALGRVDKDLFTIRSTPLVLITAALGVVATNLATQEQFRAGAGAEYPDRARVEWRRRVLHAARSPHRGSTASSSDE